jgi:FkbM family methyltransferase
MNSICRKQNLETFYESTKNKEIILCGIGDVCREFINNCLQDIKVSKIIDTKSEKQGSELYGINVYPPDCLSKERNAIIVITTILNEVKNTIEIIEKYGIFEIYTAKVLMHCTLSKVSAEIFDNYSTVQNICDLFTDEKSKYIYKEVLERRLVGREDFECLKISGDDMYIVPFMFSENMQANEVILDCGAYNGDTVKRFIDYFGGGAKKIYAFEPCKEQIEKLEAIDGKHAEIIVYPFGVGDKEQVLEFCATENPVSSFIKQNREFATKGFNYHVEQIKVVTIDNIIPVEEKVTLIKMDIEGSEYKALIGAQKTIQKHKPKLAISLYHHGVDYFRIPNLIKEFVPEYKLAVRHHSRYHHDTVLYAFL